MGQIHTIHTILFRMLIDFRDRCSSTRGKNVLVLLSLFLVLSISLVVRTSYLSLRWVPRGDEVAYIDLAKNLYEGKDYVYDTVDTLGISGKQVGVGAFPLYVGSVVLAHKLRGYSHRNAYYVNLVFSTLVTLTAFAVALRAFRSRVVAFLTALFVAFDPVLTSASIMATKEISFCLLVLLTALVLHHPKVKLHYLLLLLVQVGLVFSRRNGYWYMPSIFLVMLWHGRETNPKKNALAFVVLFVLTAILVSPFFLMVQTPGESELTAVLGYVHQQGQITSFSLSHFLRLYWQRFQVVLRSLVSVSSVVHSLILFIPIGLVRVVHPGINLFWMSSFVVFLFLLSIKSYHQTSPHYYFLAFFPAFLMYACAGYHHVIVCFKALRHKKAFLLGLIAVLAFLPASEGIRNHLHPKLKSKYDEKTTYSEMISLIQQLNNNVQPGQNVAGCSLIRHFLFELEPRLIPLPSKREDFQLEYFQRHHAPWVVVGVANLQVMDQYTQRRYLREWWKEEDGMLIEKRLPGFLKYKFGTKTERVYTLVDIHQNPSIRTRRQ